MSLLIIDFISGFSSWSLLIHDDDDDDDDDDDWLMMIIIDSWWWWLSHDDDYWFMMMIVITITIIIITIIILILIDPGQDFSSFQAWRLRSQALAKAARGAELLAKAAQQAWDQPGMLSLATGSWPTS